MPSIEDSGGRKKEKCKIRCSTDVCFLVTRVEFKMSRCIDFLDDVIGAKSKFEAFSWRALSLSPFHDHPKNINGRGIKYQSIVGSPRFI